MMEKAERDLGEVDYEKEKRAAGICVLQSEGGGWPAGRGGGGGCVVGFGGDLCGWYRRGGSNEERTGRREKGGEMCKTG